MARTSISSNPHGLPDRTLVRTMPELPRAVLAMILVAVAAVPLAGQTADEDIASMVSVTEPVMLLDMRGQAPATMVDLPAGPLFALPPIAGRLGLQLTIGPLGDRHSLVLRDETILLGPGVATMAITSADGERLVPLSQPPRRSIHGLMVPLDFLERTIGDTLGILFRWDAPNRRLEIGAREQRILRARLLQIRQGPVTTVEITLSEMPRFRADRHAEGLDILFLGDRIELREPYESDPTDARIRRIEVEPRRIRIGLGDDAAAADPRLLTSPPRLVVEVFQRRLSADRDRREERDTVSIAGDGLRTIVLDPGHGGEETGAVSDGGLVEKDLTLWFAQALARRLERRLPVRVLLTREQDHDLPLDSRTAFANQHKADLFVSLHFNSWFGKGAHGAETYFLSRSASDQRAAAAAAFDNRAGAGAAADPQLGLELILWDLAQSHHLAESQRFANLVQEELNASLGLTNRGVKQAPFRVLVGAAMPAVVVELGFLSNPAEAARLQDPGHRGELVEALLRAISRFKMQLDADSARADGASPSAEPAGRPP